MKINRSQQNLTCKTRIRIWIFVTPVPILFSFINLNCIAWPHFWWANRKQIFNERVDWTWVHLSVNKNQVQVLLEIEVSGSSLQSLGNFLRLKKNHVSCIKEEWFRWQWQTVDAHFFFFFLKFTCLVYYRF